MKNKLVTIMTVFCLCITASACGKTDNNVRQDTSDVSRQETSQSEDSSDVDSLEDSSESDEKETAEDTAERYNYAQISLPGMVVSECSEDQTAVIAKAIKSLTPADSSELTFAENAEDWQLYIYSDTGVKILERKLSADGWYLIDTDMNIYEDSTELTKLVTDAVSQNTDVITEDEKEKEYFSIDCDEPKTEEEYVAAAVECTEAWLTSLQSEDTDEYYRNKGFAITVTEEVSGKQKCNYLSCGMVNGQKEFVVEICFTAQDCGDNTFYDDFYQEGRYTEAGTFWSGQYICGRYRWCDGKCTLINMADRDGSSAMQEGLNGIQSNEYKNFYEFARRKDYSEALDESFVPYGSYTVSRNLTQTEDGKPINVDIYAHDVESETEDGYTAIWDERAYINKEATYSSGLYFTDGGTGHMPDTLPKDFALTFDNYDGDANPDFCCRYDSDDDGTFYVLESVQTDGRIFNLSGRAFQGGIYIAGCTDPSPRLQRTDDIAYIGWKKDKDGYYPTDTNGNRIELPQLNMYSDRYHLPDDLKLYSEEENEVTCFLWNNTESKIKTDETYSIEINEGGEWKTVAEGLNVKTAAVKPRECAEITYDISALKDRYNTVYRIVQKSGKLTAYGNFRLAGKETVNIAVQAKDFVIGASCGTFTVTDSGVTPTPILSAYIADGDNKYPLTLHLSDSGEYVFTASDLPTNAGKYKLVVNDSAKCDILFKGPDFKIPAFTVDAEIDNEYITLSMTCDTDCEIADITIIKIKDGVSIPCPLTSDSPNVISLKKNKSTEIELRNLFDDNVEDDELRRIYDSIKELEEKDQNRIFPQLNVDSDTTFEEFKAAFKDYLSTDPSAEHMAIISYSVDDDVYCLYKAI